MLDGLISVVSVAPEASNLLSAGGMPLAVTMTGVRAAVLIFIGFSLVIFVHELGHFVMAKLAGVRVDRFAIGFGPELAGFTRGETRYSINLLPLGGFVKMLGQEDFEFDKSGELAVRDNPRAFTNKSVGARMLIISGGVAMNIAFAALIFMVVFMIGHDAPTSVLGTIVPGSPADRAGLQYGDRVLEVDGKDIREYSDLQMAIVLAEPHEPLHFVIERNGKTLKRDVIPENNPDRNLQQIGVTPRFLPTIAWVEPEPGPTREDALKAGDRVVSVDGHPIRDAVEIYLRLRAAHGESIPMEVDRPDPADPSKTARVTCSVRARLQLIATSEDPSAVGDLLGFVPRRRIGNLVEGGPADKAGVEIGDIVARCNNIIAPTWSELVTIGETSADEPIELEVERNGERKVLTITPQGTGMFGGGKPQLGITDPMSQEQDRVVIATILDKTLDKDTPAAALRERMPRGAVVTKVNGKPVDGWPGLVRAFIDNQGHDVELTWQPSEGAPEITGKLAVPATIFSLASLPSTARITRIDGQDSAVTKRADGKHVSYDASFWRGTYELLRRHAAERPNEPVAIEYVDLLHMQDGGKSCSADLPAGDVDPWTMRVQSDLTSLLPTVELVRIQTWNPVKAMWIGMQKTYDTVVQTYQSMRRMIFTRSVGLENMSGPVGILKIGMDIAETSIVKLLFFLGFISANLAVINFLPLPIFDGGHMVFLTIEKLKGRPVSVRTQVVTQMIGLALILAAFVFVTVMDISRL